MNWILNLKAGKLETIAIDDEEIIDQILDALDGGKATCRIKVTNPDTSFTHYVVRCDNVASLVAHEGPRRARARPMRIGSP